MKDADSNVCVFYFLRLFFFAILCDKFARENEI